MAVIKCKMCGGDIQFTPGATYGTCEYCGSTSTIPKAEDEQKLNRYNRANHFRRQCEFDKALSAYEKILEQDNTDAEAHWGAVLSRYGIEYVEDPATKRRIPTCHRVQVASVLADADYQAAVENAPDTESRRLYEAQAAEIAEIQRGILAISANEKPYDVFICYKETDETGRRTRDSQWAQDVYYGLTDAGYKVFFSRITLEDKLGQQYEPYIFAALNSAKVMVVIGSKLEYFNAVWVKNEWSRYLSLMAADRKRLLIPCYRDMDPYDLPDELSALQSQDMSKIGFMQDLLRGVKKVLEAETPQPEIIQEKVTVSAVNSKTDALLKRGIMALEDGEWDKATNFFEEVLNSDAENARAYLGEAMAQKKCASLKAFVHKRLIATQTANEKEWFFSPQESHIKEIVGKYYLPNYVDLGKLKSLYIFKTSYTTTLACREEQYEKEENDWNDHKLLSKAEKFAKGEVKAYIEAQKQTLFGTLKKRVQEAEEKKEADQNQASEAHNRRLQEADSKAKAMYDAACSKREEDYQRLKKTAEKSCSFYELMELAHQYEMLGEYKDCKEQKKRCEQSASEKQTAVENGYFEAKVQLTQQKKLYEDNCKKIFGSGAKIKQTAAKEIERLKPLIEQLEKERMYCKGIKQMNTENYEEASSLFNSLGDYKESETFAKETLYRQAKGLFDAGEWKKAAAYFVDIRGYKDVDALIHEDRNLLNAVAEVINNRFAVGRYVSFGRYPQAGNNASPIEWLVLERTENRALLLSRYGLDHQLYHKEYANVTWETCSMRKWLNNDFLKKAFTAEERKAIVITRVFNANNQGFSEWNTYGGSNTLDKIFLLSYAEAYGYLRVSHNGESKQAKVSPTRYAIAQGAAEEGSWWLRSPGGIQCAAAYVNNQGGLASESVIRDFKCVRPACWVDIML